MRKLATVLALSLAATHGLPTPRGSITKKKDEAKDDAPRYLRGGISKDVEAVNSGRKPLMGRFFGSTRTNVCGWACDWNAPVSTEGDPTATCGSHVQFLLDTSRPEISETEACAEVAGQYHEDCGSCYRTHENFCGEACEDDWEKNIYTSEEPTATCGSYISRVLDNLQDPTSHGAHAEACDQIAGEASSPIYSRCDSCARGAKCAPISDFIHIQSIYFPYTREALAEGEADRGFPGYLARCPLFLDGATLCYQDWHHYPLCSFRSDFLSEADGSNSVKIQMETNPDGSLDPARVFSLANDMGANAFHYVHNNGNVEVVFVKDIITGEHPRASETLCKRDKDNLDKEHNLWLDWGITECNDDPEARRMRGLPTYPQQAYWGEGAKISTGLHVLANPEIHPLRAPINFDDQSASRAALNEPVGTWIDDGNRGNLVDDVRTMMGVCTEKLSDAIVKQEFQDIYDKLDRESSHDFWTSLIAGGVTVALGAATGGVSYFFHVGEWIESAAESTKVANFLEKAGEGIGEMLIGNLKKCAENEKCTEAYTTFGLDLASAITQNQLGNIPDSQGDLDFYRQLENLQEDSFVDESAKLHQMSNTQLLQMQAMYAPDDEGLDDAGQRFPGNSCTPEDKTRIIKAAKAAVDYVRKMRGGAVGFLNTFSGVCKGPRPCEYRKSGTDLTHVNCVNPSDVDLTKWGYLMDFVVQRSRAKRYNPYGYLCCADEYYHPDQECS